MLRRLRENPLAILFGAVAAVAVGLAVTALGTDAPSATATERTVTARKGVVQATVSGSGILEPASTHDLSFGASGKVTKVYVKAGDTVRTGQLLAKIDPSSAEATLAQAKADLQDAEDAADSDDSASATAKVAADRLTVEDAEQALAGTKLYAPIGGTIADVGVAVGDTVGSGSSSSSSDSTSSDSSSSSSTAITLVNLDRHKMTVSLSESDINDVKAGQMATVTVNAASGEEYAAKVLDVDTLSSSSSSSSSTSSSSSSASAVSYSVTLKLTQSSRTLKSGMSATAEIVTSQTSGLVVPTSALSGNTVTVVRNGVKSTRQVQTGVAGDSTTQITSGLTAGETVVVTSASAAAGAAASSSTTSSSGSGQSQSGSGVAGALGGGTSGGGMDGGPPSGGGAPAGGGR
jgi:membrane fusion protein, macrolide-specific efflux system